MGERKKGGQPGNRNRAKNNQYPRRIVSLSGSEYDAAMTRLARQGKNNPTDKEVVREMSELDWAQFGFTLDMSPEEGAEIIEKSALAAIRKEYQWIKECEDMPLERLREEVAHKPSASTGKSDLKRHRQAVIVLESRE